MIYLIWGEDSMASSQGYLDYVLGPYSGVVG